ncbi:helix-turn-helix domain-containing protein [Brevibacillus antibioticus]|uniref:Helix-turn-helix domain-containing protein n=1 Tax=Brevibacillus antibioticus TaxID=2570228 RepID=A0A4U2Y777_9BACL|nr:helix-turn-helix transcriptional regulator [Brevibacillus antibioticus]TKI56005.1 helix-turn-helix domain-containing protein [Brevibacillus antibioticus]
MSQQNSYTTEEIAKILRISKLTVYDLIKKGELPAYRVGRQMRVDESDLEAYKAKAKGEYRQASAVNIPQTGQAQQSSRYEQTGIGRNIIISGQDVSLDLLAGHLEKKDEAYRPLRSYVGSLNSLVAMYTGKADIVSTHLYDGDTNEYNVPYIRRILCGHRFVVINMLSRWAGFYVQAGNPKQMKAWSDFTKPGIRMVNREKGSGARTLIEEQFRLANIVGSDVIGYGREESNHLAVAGVVARREADVGVGIEKAASLVGVEFVPTIRERYDLVLLKNKDNEPLIQAVLDVLDSRPFQKELEAVGGYDLSQTGKIMYETR